MKATRTQTPIAKTLAAFAALVAVSLPAAHAADFSYSDDLKYDPSFSIGDTASAATDWFSSTGGEWTGGNTYTLGKWSTNPNASSQFLLKNLHDSGILAADKAISEATVQLYSAWGSGAATNTMGIYIGLLNDEGKGYVAFADRLGNVTFYSIDQQFSNDVSTWTLLSSGSPVRPASQTTTFTLDASSITLTSTHGDAVLQRYSFGDNGIAYSGLNTLVIGAMQTNNQEVRFTDLNITGTLSQIPEPSVGVFVLGLGSLLAFVLRRRFSLFRVASR